MNGKTLLVLTIFGLACGSCATTGSMGGNPFRPTYKIAKEFVRSDRVSGLVDIGSPDEGVTTSALTETEIYIEQDRRMVKRYIMLKTLRLDRDLTWRAGNYSDPSFLDHGVAKLGGKNYEYHSRFLRANVPSGAGYTMPKCYYQVWWERDLTDQVKFQFVYVEDVTQFGVACGDFEKGKPFSEKVREYIQASNQRFTDALQLSP